MGDTVGIAPLAVLVVVTAVGLLFGAAYVPLAVPFTAVAATLVDVLVRGKEPATEEVPTVLFDSGDLKKYQKKVETKTRRRVGARDPETSPVGGRALCAVGLSFAIFALCYLSYARSRSGRYD